MSYYKRLLRFQKQLAKQDLLIVDELGYVPLSKTGAELLFEIFSQRYEQASTLVTSNLPFNDPVWYVRAHAARAIGRLGCADRVDEVAKLLADREWWVRAAAKEALEELGPVVWREIVPYLEHSDEFARNGAAEILQNNGVLDSLLVLESATASPSPEKVAVLRKIAAAGSARLTQAFAERIEEPLRSRLHELAAELGLDIAGAEV